MSSTHFRLEPFRPWTPSQDKAHPGRKRLDLCRYPSPVSISAAPSSPHQKSLVSQSPNVNAPGPEQHPLPARPPAEVCLNSSLELGPQSTQSEREVLALPSSVEPEPGISSCFPDCVPNFRNVDLTMPFDDMVHDPGHQFSRFSSSDRELVSTIDQHSQPGFIGGTIHTGDSSCDATIDPTILHDHHPRDVDETQEREIIPENAPSTGRSPVQYTCSSHEDTHCDCDQENPRNALEPGGRLSKTNKISVVNNRRKKGAGRFTQRDIGRRSSHSLRAQFSALSVEDRVQFLSWLFEGALSRCLSPLSSTVATSTADDTKHAEPSFSAEDTSAEPHFSRKGSPWSAEEDRLLVKLKEEENLTTAEVIRRFDKSFPGRSPGSIQVHWSTKFSKRRSLLAKSS